MWHKALTSILSFLLCFQLFGQNLSDLSFGTDSTLEVVTWNIEWFPKNGEITVDSVSKIIEALDADLIGLQEIDDTAKCREMIDNLPGYDLFMDDDWFGGLAYVYKTSSIEVNSIYKIYDTEAYWNAFPRSPLVIELTFMGEEIIVINNHLKCCGDGELNLGNTSDEEYRRYQASALLKQYIDLNFNTSRVIVIGDLNDVLTDAAPNNVFQLFLDDPVHYRFADEAIASGPESEWSFPGWPSHLDHVLITNELFEDISNDGSGIETIKVDDYLPDGLEDYDWNISDHRPVGLKLKLKPTVAGQIELSAINTSIFPNPASGHFLINLGETHEFVKVNIVSLDGKILQSDTYSNSQLITVDFVAPSGVYLVIVESEKNRFVSKLIQR